MAYLEGTVKRIATYRGVIYVFGYLDGLTPAGSEYVSNASNSAVAELEKLYDLKEKGGIYQEEYDSRKKTLLGEP